MCVGHYHATTVELVEMLFGRQSLVHPRNHVLDGVHIFATWKIQWISLFGGTDAGCRYHYCSNLYIYCSLMIKVVPCCT